MSKRKFKVSYTLTYRDGSTHTGGACFVNAETEEDAKEDMNSSPHAGAYTFLSVEDLGPAPVYEPRHWLSPPSPYFKVNPR